MNLKKRMITSFLPIKLGRLISLYCCAISLSISVLLFPSSVFAEKNVHIAVVNVSHIIKNAPQTKQSNLKLKEKFLPKEKALLKQSNQISQLEAEKNKNDFSLSNDKKAQLVREIRTLKRTYRRNLEDFREELRFVREDALDKVQTEVYQAIGAVREQQGIDIVIQEFVSASPRVNITTAVLDYLSEKIKPKTATEALPKKQQGNDGNFIPQ
ncbi:MAG: OmpH family outer membrane protein [Cocleimonas sp.]|nr:OmpH family outer membrane protein [Cocleimonas sp.]